MPTELPVKNQSQNAKGTAGLLKSTVAFGSMTTISRLTGLIRDIIFAQLIGSSYIADAFFVAFRIPNFFRRIFGEGAFSAAFIPVYTQYRVSAPKEQTREFVNIVTGRLTLVLLVLTALGVIFAPLIVSVLAPGFRTEPEKYQVTVDSLRLTFPYVLFICLVAASAAILNTHKRFAAPAATPILLNFSLIGAALWITGLVENAAIALSIGVFIAGVIQLLFQLPFLYKINAIPTPSLKFGEKNKAKKGVREVYRLMIPSIFGSSVAQINLLVNTFIASFLITGSVSWLYYSDRLLEFPLGVFGVALGSVILPKLSEVHANKHRVEFSKLLDWGLRWSVLISVPATVGLIVLSHYALAALFFHGAFTETDVIMSARALIAYSIGLIALVTVRVLSPGFFARNDTKTPVRAGVIAMILNMFFAVALVFPLQHVGLALATSLAAFINAGLLFYWLVRDKTLHLQSGWILFLIRVVIASTIMGFLLLWIAPPLTNWLDYSVIERVVRLIIYTVVGGGVYAMSILLFGIRFNQLIQR